MHLVWGRCCAAVVLGWEEWQGMESLAIGLQVELGAVALGWLRTEKQGGLRPLEGLSIS